MRHRSRWAGAGLAMIAGLCITGSAAQAADAPKPITPTAADAKLAPATEKGAQRVLQEVARLDSLPEDSYVPGEAIVRYRDADATAAKRSALTAVGATADREALRAYDGELQLVRFPKGTDLRAALTKLNDDPAVAYAEPNFIARNSAIPNDPLWPQQWQFLQTHAPLAWDSAAGGGVNIAVLDSGIDMNHTEFAGKAYGWWDAIDEDAYPFDNDGHGTAVTGVALAAAQNHVGIAGMAHWSNYVAIRVCSLNRCPWVDILEAFPHITSTGVRVVNMSLGGTSPVQAAHDAIAARPNVLFVAAAGNEDTDLSGPTGVYPCSHPLDNIICVGASDSNTNRDTWSGSNFDSGPIDQADVDVAAPVSLADGTGAILTTTASSGSGYGHKWGTSFAAPQVSGIAAIILNMRPNTPAFQLRALIKLCTNRTPGMVGVVATGIVSAGCVTNFLNANPGWYA